MKMLKLLVRKDGVCGGVWREYNDMPDVATAHRMAAIMADQGFETCIEDDPATYDAVEDRWYPVVGCVECGGEGSIWESTGLGLSGKRTLCRLCNA